MSIILVIVFAILTYISITRYWETEIDESFECIQFVIGEETFEPINFRIKGTLYKSLTRDDYISYKLWVGNEVFPKDNELLFSKTVQKTFLRKFIWNYETKSNYVNEIQVHVNEIPNGYQIVSSYNYLMNETMTSINDIQRNINGVLFFNKEFSEVIMLLCKERDSGYSCGSRVGNTIIVSADDIFDAEKLVWEVGNFKIGK